MRGSGPIDDTWKEVGRPPGDASGSCDVAMLDAAKAWLARVAVRKLQLHMQATEPGHAERQMAFTAMADELRDTLEHLRNVLTVAEQLKADNTVLRKALERQRMKGATAPPVG